MRGMERVTRIRDVTLDQTAHYQLDDFDAGQLVPEQELQEAIYILKEILESIPANNQDEEEVGIPITDTTNHGDNTPISPRPPPPKTPPAESQPYHTPTPSVPHDATHTTSSSTSTSETQGRDGEDGNWEYRPIGAAAPHSQEVSVNFNEGHILPKRTRNRREAHAAALTSLDCLSGHHAAYAPDHITIMDHLHRDKLPKEPKHWKEMLKHPHGQYFIQAAHNEFGHLKSRRTFADPRQDQAFCR